MQLSGARTRTLVCVAVGFGMLGAAPARAAQTIADDLVVLGSVCTGLDCTGTESFGYDTHRMRENNLRMHFDDTSVSAGFAANDWRFLFNDIGNAGGSYFALEDSTAGRIPFRVDAQAPTDSLRVASSGQVGIGTDAPAQQLHLKTGNTPTVRLQQDGLQGWSPYTWDLSGDETAFNVRDVTSDVSPFSIRAGAPSNSLVVASDGDVGVGVAAQAPLHVSRGDGSTRLLIEERDTTPAERVLAELRNTGPVALKLTNSKSAAASWLLRTGASDEFTIGPEGAGFKPLTLTPDGGVRAAGALEQSATSDVSENEQAVDGAAFMTALRGLSLNAREYAADPTDTVHLWPTGADFSAAFGLGTAQHVSPTDMAGVALVTIKALDSRISGLEAAGAVTGPKGDAGPAGPAGLAGTSGGSPDVSGLVAVNTQQNRSISKLARANKKLARANKKLLRRLIKLERKLR